MERSDKTAAFLLRMPRARICDQDVLKRTQKRALTMGGEMASIQRNVMPLHFLLVERPKAFDYVSF